MKTTCVTKKCVKSVIDGKVRKLRKADGKPSVHIPRTGKASLMVTRYGNTEALPISRRVAEELIAVGFGYGN